MTPTEQSALEPGDPPRDDAGGPTRRVVLVTGLSGAGISTALKAFEDIGYEVFDNLPLALAPALIAQERQADRPIAIGIDSRTRDFSAADLLLRLDALGHAKDLDVRLVLIECDTDVLQRRFNQTRRRHPLAVDRPVADGIRLEVELLAPLRGKVDLLIDTSLLTIHDLRRLIAGNFAHRTEARLLVCVTSFSFGRGLPREADLVFDVRFLRNPYWDVRLRPMTGREDAVQAAIMEDPDFESFSNQLTDLLTTLLPRYTLEGKSYLTIAVGCSGGRHRSVFVAERLAAWLRNRNHKVQLLHRELGHDDSR